MLKAGDSVIFSAIMPLWEFGIGIVTETHLPDFSEVTFVIPNKYLIYINDEMGSQ